MRTHRSLLVLFCAICWSRKYLKTLTHTHKNTAECFTGRFLLYYFSSRQRVLTREWSQHDRAALCFHFLNVGLIAVFVRWQIFRIISKSPFFIFVGKNKCAASIQ